MKILLTYDISWEDDELDTQERSELRKSAVEIFLHASRNEVADGVEIQGVLTEDEWDSLNNSTLVKQMAGFMPQSIWEEG
jgi:hypothetical protein